MVLEALAACAGATATYVMFSLWDPMAQWLADHVACPSLLLSVSLLILAQKLWHQHVLAQTDRESKLPLPPGNFGLPFIGETLSLVFKGATFFKDRQNNYGNVFKTHILGNPTVRIIGPKNVGKILKHEQGLLTTQWPLSVRMILGEGSLALASGHVHKHRRKCVMQAFRHDALSGYVPTIRRTLERYLIGWSQNDVTLGYPEIKKMLFGVACETLLGFKMNPTKERKMLVIFQDITRNIFSLPIRFPGTGLYKGMEARKALLRQIDDCIREHESHSLEGATDGLSHILRHAETESMTRAELKDLALELLWAGHETLGSAASSILIHLGQNPHVVHRAFTEISEIELEHGSAAVGEDGQAGVTYDVINKMTYVGNIVKETLRLLPPVGGAFRRALKTFEINGHQIPRGWAVNYSIRQTHLCSGTFSDVDRFDPDRWENVREYDLKRQYKFIPFGGGSRACAGKAFALLVLKLFVVELVTNWSFKLLNSNPKMDLFPVPKPRDNLPVRIRRLSGYRRRAFTV